MTKIKIIALIFISISVSSHEFKPAKLIIVENNDSYRINFVRPNNSTPMSIKPNEDCASINKYNLQITGNEINSFWEITCINGASLSVIEVGGLNDSPIEIFFTYENQDQEVLRSVLNEQNSIIFLDADSLSNNYFELGVWHLISGWDHIFLIILLFFLSSNFISLLKVVTAFTIGHSLTLALAFLDILNLSQAPIEALIALTLIMLAKDLISHNKAPNTYALTGFLFGFIHGLGFYGVLNKLDYDIGAVVETLFYFNIGIEIGQIIILVGLYLITKILLDRLFTKRVITTVSAFVIGGISTYWFIDRSMIIFYT